MIGRAFSRGKKIIPLIFDLVANSQFISETADNFPNELRGEIEKRKKEYEKEGTKYEVGFNVDEFIVMDQFMDVVSGFKAIEERLEGSWDLWVKSLKQYREREGDCDVPWDHVEIVDGVGVKLGQWCMNIRSVKKGQSNYSLANERIKQLDEIGFIWDVYLYDWKNGLKHFDKYVREHNGNVLVPASYVDDGFPIGQWVYCRRYEFKNKNLDCEKIYDLNERGFVWDVHKYRFEDNVKAVAEYCKKYNKYPSGKSKDLEERRLGGFLCKEKSKMRDDKIVYSEWKKKIINRYLPDLSYEHKDIKKFNNLIFFIELYKEKYGHTNIKIEDIVDGFPIGRTLSNLKHRQIYGKQLTEEQINKLEKLGVYLGNKIEKQFNDTMELAKQAVKDGVIISKKNSKYKERNLYIWILKLKKRYKANKLTLEEIKVIERLIGKSLDDLYCGRKEPVKAKVVDVLENKVIGIFESQKEAARVMREKYVIKINDGIIRNRLTGKITTPYKGRFMFYRVDENGEVTE